MFAHFFSMREQDKPKSKPKPLPLIAKPEIKKVPEKKQIIMEPPKKIIDESFKERLKQLVTDSNPDDFLDFRDFDFIEEPVISEAGHVYDKTSIEKWLTIHAASPYTNKPLTLNQLSDAPELKNIIRQLSTQQKQILSQIRLESALEKKADLEENVYHYLSSVIHHKEMFHQFRENHRIYSFKNRLKININDEKHIKFWNEPRFHSFGTVDFPFQANHYKISQPIYRVMLAANQPYTKVAELEANVQKAREYPVSCWCRFWQSERANEVMRDPDFLKKDFRREFK